MKVSEDFKHLRFQAMFLKIENKIKGICNVVLTSAMFWFLRMT